MRKFFVSIVILMSLVMPLLLQLGLLFHHKYEMKEELKELLEERKIQNDIVILVFSEEQFQSQLKWEHEHEFEYQGQMYDVVETTQADGKYHIRCYKDEKETHLKEKLVEFFAFGFSNEKQNSDHQKNLQKFYNSLFFENHQIEFSLYHQTKMLHSSGLFSVIEVGMAVLDPPPKF